MLESIKDHARKINLLISGIFFSISVVFFLIPEIMYPGCGWFFKALHGSTNVYEIPTDNLSGKYVDGDIYFLIDYFAEYYTNRKKVKELEDRFYVILNPDGKYMAVKITKDNLSKAESISNQVYNYFLGNIEQVEESIYMKGYIEKMSKSEQEYYYQWFKAADGYLYDDFNQIRDNILPYILIDEPELPNIVFTFCIIGGVLLCVSLFFLFQVILNIPIKRFLKTIEKNGGSTYLERLDEDYASSEECGPVKVGNAFLFIKYKLKDTIIPLNMITKVLIEDRILSITTEDNVLFHIKLMNHSRTQDVLKILKHRRLDLFPEDDEII